MHISRSTFAALLLASNVNADLDGRRQIDPECAARENGQELFPPTDPTEQQVKLESVIDTASCTYDVTVSWKPDNSMPFIDSAKGGKGLGRPPKFDTPYNFEELCDADGFTDEGLPVDAPGRVLTVEDHTGTKEYYTESTYAVFTSDKVAEMTGVREVVLGATPCGQGPLKFPGFSVHFFHTSSKDARQEYRCVTGGGYFCKPFDQQCSDHGRKMIPASVLCDMGAGTCVENSGNTDLEILRSVYCDPDNITVNSWSKNLPAGYIWSIDGPWGSNNSAGSQGMHAINSAEFFGQSDSIPKHLILQYNGELTANHVVISAGFAMGLGAKNEYTKDLDWSTGSCVDPDVKKLSDKVTTKYDPDTGRTSVTAHGPLKECSGDSFTDVIDYSTPKPSSKSGKGKGSKGAGPPMPEPEPESTCGHQKALFVEAPYFIKNNFFREGGARVDFAGSPVQDSLDYNVYQDPFFKVNDITEEQHYDFTTFGPNGNFRVVKLTERAGEHRGVDFSIRDQVALAPSATGGSGPNLAMADIVIDHPDHGTGTIKVNGYSNNFGEGDLAILGGTGDFVGAVVLVRPYFGMIYMDPDTLAKFGIEVQAAFTFTASLQDGTPLSLGFFLDMDFICRGI